MSWIQEDPDGATVDTATSLLHLQNTADSATAMLIGRIAHEPYCSFASLNPCGCRAVGTGLNTQDPEQRVERSVISNAEHGNDFREDRNASSQINGSDAFAAKEFGRQSAFSRCGSPS